MKRTSIRFRLMLIMICLAIIPVITLTWIATNNTRNSVEKEIINANTSRMMWADQYLNELIDQIDTMFYTVQINQKLMDGLNDIESSDIRVQYSTQNYIRDTLTSVFYSNSRKVDDLTIYIHSNHKAFSVNFASSGLVSSLDIRSGSWSRMLKMPINMYFKQTSKGIYAFHSINRFEDHKLLGGLSVQINREVWDAVSSILKSESESSVYLINDEGEMLSGSTKTGDSKEIGSQLHSLNLQNSKLIIQTTKDYLFFMKKVGDGQLTIVKAIPLESISKSAKNTITAGILTGTLFAVISLILSILVSLRITRPIVSLAKTMNLAQIHDFEIKTVKSSDEIGMLERGYNSMMQRIKELIDGEYKQKIELKNAQLLALQAQINPHFLNNTLNLIGGMALSKNAPEIYNITRVIGDLLRYSISTEGAMVSLEDELQHMQNYIYIQEHRFIGRCSVKVSSDIRVSGCKLPKFTLQPIVENAFEHGLQRKEGNWNMEIRVKSIGNRIIIIVKDNGVGLERECLKQIRYDLKSGISISAELSFGNVPKKRGGIGLRNVNSRLKLQFGDVYGARIFSKLKCGTVVLLVLPLQNLEGERNV